MKKNSTRTVRDFPSTCYPSCPKPLIMMMKSDAIIVYVALPIMVQTIRIGSKHITITTVRTKSMHKKSLEIVMVLWGKIVKIIKSRRTIIWRDNYHSFMVVFQLKSIWIGSMMLRSFSTIWILQKTSKFVWWLTSWREVHLPGGIIFD